LPASCSCRKMSSASFALWQAVNRRSSAGICSREGSAESPSDAANAPGWTWNVGEVYNVRSLNFVS
jgi:hypothetical protein